MAVFQYFNQMMEQIKIFFNNPMGFLAGRGLNIPSEYSNNPDAAIQYLMDSGRMSQDQYNYLKGMAEQMQKMQGGTNGVPGGPNFR